MHLTTRIAFLLRENEIMALAGHSNEVGIETTSLADGEPAPLIWPLRCVFGAVILLRDVDLLYFSHPKVQDYIGPAPSPG
jgi:hypothetical protein